MQKKTDTTLNLPVNVAGALCYVPWIGWVVGIVVLLLEKNAELRWHAIQGLMLMGVFFGLSIILIPLASVFMVAGLIIEIFVTVKVYNGEKIRLYKLGEWTDAVIKKIM